MRLVLAGVGVSTFKRKAFVRGRMAMPQRPHILGIDDAPFVKGQDGDVPVVGVMMEGATLVEGVALGAFPVDGAGATDYLAGRGLDTFVLIGRPLQADAMAAAGFDVMSISTNHIKNCGLTNCGETPFYDTLSHLARAGIWTVGAGDNLEEANRPLVLEINDIRFGFVSLGQIESSVFAGEDSPGIGVLNEENLVKAIQDARQVSDFVIFLPHWGPEYSHYPNASQMALAQLAVEAGADLIIGNHTHYIQAFVNIDDIPVFFGLGNFVFDQTQEARRQQSIIVRVIIQGTSYLTHEIIPVVNDQTGKVRVANQEEAVQILEDIQEINAEVQSLLD